jgi:phage shock protein B
MSGLVHLCAVLAPFVMVILLVKMRHDRQMRELGLKTMSADEQRALQEMSEVARRMETRIQNLERILDAEVAGWRSRTPV